MSICTEYSEYIKEYQENNPCWIVTLNNGLVVFQDDNRPNVTPTSSWERLYNYCNNNHTYITNMKIQFRTNQHTLADNADGYYFSKGVRGGFGMVKTLQLFFVGTLFNDVLNVTCWKVPEMLEEITEQRNPKEAGICLISKSINQSTVQKV